MDVLTKFYPTIPLSGDSEMVRRYLYLSFANNILSPCVFTFSLTLHRYLLSSFFRYEAFMKTFGKSNSMQSSSQTGDDNMQVSSKLFTQKAILKVPSHQFRSA